MSVVQQLQALQAANRCAPDGEAEARLVELRLQAFAMQQKHLSRQCVPVPDADGAEYGLPIIPAADLNANLLRDAISRYGALHVRGLVSEPQVEAMREVIDRALAAQEAAYDGVPPGETLPWYQHTDDLPNIALARPWVRAAGAVLAVQSPRGFFHLLEMFYELGLDRLIAEFFGERPALAAEKTTFRRMAPVTLRDGWHQDGRFLGAGIRSLNVWIAHSDCGIDAPGLELVPKRLYRILDTGTADPTFAWVASHSVIERQFPGVLIRPQFKAGDALLFDHFLMHRTSSTEGMTRPRYATESWFFAPSAYPEGQTGLYV